MYIKSPQFPEPRLLMRKYSIRRISSFGVLLRRFVLRTFITSWSINKKKSPRFWSKRKIIDCSSWNRTNYYGKERWDWWTVARFLAAVRGWLRDCITSYNSSWAKKIFSRALVITVQAPKLLTLILISVSSLKLVREKMSRFRRESEAIFSLHDCKVHQKSSRLFDAIFSKTNSEDYALLS